MRASSILITALATATSSQAQQSFKNGRMSLYRPSAGNSSCGLAFGDYERVARISAKLFVEWDPWKEEEAAEAGEPTVNPSCQKTVTISRGEKSIMAKVVDKCGDCGDDELMVSPGAFRELEEVANETTVDWTLSA